MNKEFRIAITTIGSIEDANVLSERIILNRLAACVNSILIQNSCYTWDGKLENSPEVLLMIKTKRDSLPDLNKLLDAHHPYKTYFFSVVCPESINQAYFDWLLINTKS